MRLKQIRLERAYAMRGLALAADVSQSTIRNIEHDITHPSLVTCRKLAKALEVEPKDIDECREVIDDLLRH